MRGEKITELLKQPQYQPQAIEDQVALIYAASSGFVNDIETARLAEWSRSFLHAQQVRRFTTIAKSGQLSDDIEDARRGDRRVQQELLTCRPYAIYATASGR